MGMVLGSCYYCWDRNCSCEDKYHVHEPFIGPRQPPVDFEIKESYHEDSLNKMCTNLKMSDIEK